MAQVSVQYCLDKELSIHDEKTLKRILDKFPGVTSVSVNVLDGILCVDYDDTGVKREQLEACLKEESYVYTMIDQITF